MSKRKKTSREEFELWAESSGWNIDRTDEGDYRTMSTDAAWGGWLACELLHESKSRRYLRQQEAEFAEGERVMMYGA